MNPQRKLGDIMQGFLSASDCDLDAFKALCLQNLDPKDVPHSAVINANVPIYDCAALAENIDPTKDGGKSWRNGPRF